VEAETSRLDDGLIVLSLARSRLWSAEIPFSRPIKLSDTALLILGEIKRYDAVSIDLERSLGAPQTLGPLGRL
jgi:hypothetical protein